MLLFNAQKLKVEGMGWNGMESLLMFHKDVQELELRKLQPNINGPVRIQREEGARLATITREINHYVASN